MFQSDAPNVPPYSLVGGGGLRPRFRARCPNRDYNHHMRSKEFYERPYVREIRAIFNNPQPPSKIVEQQFDGWDDELGRLARTPWHEIDDGQWHYYMLDLAWVQALQGDLFEYLFPYLLCIWKEGLDARIDQPYGQIDLYAAIHKGNLFNKLMSEGGSREVGGWMSRWFVDSVDRLRLTESLCGADRKRPLHFLPWAFNALGQSTPYLSRTISQLLIASTPGRSRFWLILAAGLLYNENEVPWIAPWTPEEGGGGVYLTESAGEIYDAGFLESNLGAYRLM